MGTIRRLVLKNFKRFKALELEFDPELNILVGPCYGGQRPSMLGMSLLVTFDKVFNNAAPR